MKSVIPELIPRLRRWPRAAAFLRRWKYSTHLLLEGKWWAFLGVDLILLINGLIQALVAGGTLKELYFPIVVFPTTVLGVPALAAVVALERRAGSLDLALATPHTERYFCNRIVPIALPLLAQSWLIILVAPVSGVGHQRVRALVMSLELTALVVAIVLFWALRQQGAGGVVVASWTSLLLCRALVPFGPVSPDPLAHANLFFKIPVHAIQGLWHIALLGLAGLIFYLYARQRLRRPESMLP